MTLGLEVHSTVEGRPLKLRETKNMSSAGKLQHTEFTEDSGRQWGKTDKVTKALKVTEWSD